MVQHGLGCKGVRSPWCTMSFGANIGRRVGCFFFSRPISGSDLDFGPFLNMPLQQSILPSIL